MQAPGPESGPPQDVRWVHEKIAYLQEQLSANPSQLQPPVAAVLSQLCTPTAAGNTPVAAVLSQLCAAAGSSDHNPSFGGAAPAITVWKVPFKQEGGGDAGKGAAVLQRAGAQDKQEEGVNAGKSAALLPQLKPLSDDSQNQAVAGLLSLAQSLSRKRPASDLWAGHASSGGAASQGVHPALGHANMGQAAGSEKKHRPVYTPEQIKMLTEGYNNGHSKPKSKCEKRFLTPTQREALAAKTGLTLAQVDTWLHNRRKNR
jgi:hypothetical protein